MLYVTDKVEKTIEVTSSGTCSSVKPFEACCICRDHMDPLSINLKKIKMNTPWVWLEVVFAVYLLQSVLTCMDSGRGALSTCIEA